jgi:hypothetical protein
MNKSVDYLHDPPKRRKILLSTVLVLGVFTTGIILGHRLHSATEQPKPSMDEQHTTTSTTQPNIPLNVEKGEPTPGEKLAKEIEEDQVRLDTSSTTQLLETLVGQSTRPTIAPVEANTIVPDWTELGEVESTAESDKSKDSSSSDEEYFTADDETDQTSSVVQPSESAPQEQTKTSPNISPTPTVVQPSRVTLSTPQLPDEAEEQQLQQSPPPSAKDGYWEKAQNTLETVKLKTTEMGSWLYKTGSEWLNYYINPEEWNSEDS